MDRRMRLHQLQATQGGASFTRTPTRRTFSKTMVNVDECKCIVETFKNKRAPPEGIWICGQKFKFIGCVDEEQDDQKFVVLRMKLDKKNAIACKTKTQIVVALADEEK